MACERIPRRELMARREDTVPAERTWKSATLRGTRTTILQSKEDDMSKEAAEHHQKAAEHHEHAARHHREAAKHHEAGNHEKAAHHAHVAHGHHLHATHHAGEAAKAHAEHHGKK